MQSSFQGEEQGHHFYSPGYSSGKKGKEPDSCGNGFCKGSLPKQNVYMCACVHVCFVRVYVHMHIYWKMGL